jgi:phospholipid/cholesterol/gamma-HCH transport system substrate-binding protein
MRLIKFNHYERVAGVFLLVAILGSALTGLSVAIKQGWFESKIQFFTILESGDGIHSGTSVQMAGLRAGAVDEVELQSTNKIKVSFHVLGKFQDKLREDSRAMLVRPFIIGDRILEITVGSEQSPALAENSAIPSEETIDIMTIMSGRKLGNYLSQFSDLVSNLHSLVQSFLNKERTDSMVRIFDKLDPLLGNMNMMSLEVTNLSRQATRDGNLKKIMVNLVVMSKEINKILPALNRLNPELASHLAILIRNLAEVSVAMKDLSPEMPGATKKAIEALAEATVLLKALQRNYFLKSSVADIRQEDAKKEAASRGAGDHKRKPARTGRP